MVCCQLSLTPFVVAVIDLHASITPFHQGLLLEVVAIATRFFNADTRAMTQAERLVVSIPMVHLAREECLTALQG